MATHRSLQIAADIEREFAPACERAGFPVDQAIL